MSTKFDLSINYLIFNIDYIMIEYLSHSEHVVHTYFQLIHIKVLTRFLFVIHHHSFSQLHHFQVKKKSCRMYILTYMFAVVVVVVDKLW